MMIPPKPIDVTWTDDQWKAIFSKGQDTLVAAAAGSGKTAVLVQRIIEKLINKEEPINVDELLVVTFTNASAQEMRHRIGEAIEKELEKNPNSSHLRQQLTLLNKASISTLHSFCLDVIRKYYYMIELDPVFRIGDETEMELMGDDVLEEVMETYYSGENAEVFFQLVDMFSNDRSDDQLLRMIRQLYLFSQSHPKPFFWLETLPDLYDVTNESFEENDLTLSAKRMIALELSGATALLQQAYDLTLKPGGPAALGETLQQDLAVIQALQHSLGEKWDESREHWLKAAFPRAKAVKGADVDPDLKDRATSYRNKAKKIVEGMKEEWFSLSSASWVRQMQEMKPYIAQLAELVQRFTDAFQKRKREENVVDFSDLEHYCLAILQAEELTAAESYQNKFKEILVDEYQDTNMVQESIIQAIKKPTEEAGNLFMVGDVKQSIYRFRLAEPTLFLLKYGRFTDEAIDSGQKIDLSRNFRSRYEVLEGTNFLFRQLLSKSVGEMDYERAAELIPGAAFPETEQHPITMAFIDQSTHESQVSEEDAEEDLAQAQLEARYIAKEIKKMLENGEQTYDAKRKQHRTIRYRDVVILMRSMTWTAAIQEELKKAGIPSYANLSTGYFEATEVTIMMSLLSVIDNPYQDIPIASVLRSPIVMLNEEQLAEIRNAHPKGYFYEAVNAYVASGANEECVTRLKRFLTLLHKWRTKARQGSLAELIWEIYRDTRYYDFVGGTAGGKQRQANLRALYDRARQYEKTSFRGLFRFLRFIERMQERGDDLGTARALSEQEDVVRIMTIHASKGLEFPVVYLAGMGRSFNMMDIRKSYMLDKEVGIATSYVNTEKRYTMPSFPQQVLKKKKRLEMLSEEMRVLYVALTRPQERLTIISTSKDLEKDLYNWAEPIQEKEWVLPEYYRMQAKRPIDWIAPAIMRHHEVDLPIDVERTEFDHPSSFSLKFVHHQSLLLEDEQKSVAEDGWIHSLLEGKVDREVTDWKEKVYDQFTWSYPYERSTAVRSKQSVTELKRIMETAREDQDHGWLQKGGIRKPLYERPKFMREKALSSAEIGTAHHLVMQYLSFEEAPTRESLRFIKEELIQKELATEVQMEAIQEEKILAFFESWLGEQALVADQVMKEVPFSLGIPASQLEASDELLNQEDTVIVQGIVDCLFQVNGKWTLLDYKTDTWLTFKGETEEETLGRMEERYRSQLKLYRKAIETIWNIEVDQTALFFFDGGHIILIEE